MTREELLAERQYLDVKDIMKIFDCSETLAYRTIREIHTVSNIGNRAGRILVRDYENWLLAKGGKVNNDNKTNN
ncbi:MAG: hypothetical protein RSA23_10000 [Carnobacterium sp.]